MSAAAGIAADIEAVIGAELTAQLLARRGGTEIVIPVRPAGSLLASIVGEDAARQLAQALGAGRIVLPCGDMRGIRRRRAAAMRMLRAGKSNLEVALDCDLHIRTITNYRAEIEAEDASRQLKLPFDSL